MLAKARFWDSVAAITLNDRQRNVLNRLLEGFEGNLTTSKYQKLAKSSQDTALRDILYLVDNGILVRNPGGGRSTSYSLAPPSSKVSSFCRRFLGAYLYCATYGCSA